MALDTWLKLHTSLLTSSKFVSLPSNDHRWAFICLLLLTKKGLESSPECYLLAHLSMGKRRWGTVRKDLINCGLLDTGGTVNGFTESQLSPDALRMRKNRAPNKSRTNPEQVRTEVEAEVDVDKNPPTPHRGAGVKKKAQEVLDYWNVRHRRKITTIDKIADRIKQGATVEECMKVIDFKTKAWTGTKLQKNIQPATLFAPSHFKDYLSEAIEGEVKDNEFPRY